MRCEERGFWGLPWSPHEGGNSLTTEFGGDPELPTAQWLMPWGWCWHWGAQMDRKDGFLRALLTAEPTSLETYPTSGLAISIIHFLVIQANFSRSLFLAPKSTLTIGFPWSQPSEGRCDLLSLLMQRVPYFKIHRNWVEQLWEWRLRQDRDYGVKCSGAKFKGDTKELSIRDKSHFKPILKISESMTKIHDKQSIKTLSEDRVSITNFSLRVRFPHGSAGLCQLLPRDGMGL